MKRVQNLPAHLNIKSVHNYNISLLQLFVEIGNLRADFLNDTLSSPDSCGSHRSAAPRLMIHLCRSELVMCDRVAMCQCNTACRLHRNMLVDDGTSALFGTSVNLPAKIYLVIISLQIILALYTIHFIIKRILYSLKCIYINHLSSF